MEENMVPTPGFIEEVYFTSFLGTTRGKAYKHEVEQKESECYCMYSVYSLDE